MTASRQEALAAAIQKAAVKEALAGGEPVRVLGYQQERALTESFHSSLGRIYAAAMAEGIYPERFLRNASALSLRDQARLLNRRVAVVGLGGLGGYTVEILARIGVGAMTLIDGDRFEESNLNRQLLSTIGALGKTKADEAEQRIRSINPAVELAVHSEFFGRADALRLFENADLVLDCLDSISVRFELEAAARAARKPMVSAAVAGASGHVTTVFPQDRGLSLIYGENGSSTEKGSEAELGCLPQAVALLASVEASEAVKVLLGKEGLLRNRLLVVDLFENTFEIMQLD